MSSQNRWLLLGLLALGAIVCYSVGFIAGTFVLVAIGAVLELSFWVAVFRNFLKMKK